MRALLRSIARRLRPRPARLAPAIPPPPPETLYAEAPYPPETTYRHHDPATLRDLTVPPCHGVLTRPAAARRVTIPEQYLVELHDVVCLPRQVILQGGHVLPDSFRRRNARHAHVQLARMDDGRFRATVPAEPQITITEPCFYFDGEHADHFGHFTLEVMSRLWAAGVQDLSSLVFLSSARPAARHLDLLAPFGIRASQLRYVRVPVRCKTLLVASQGYVLEGSVSDAALAVWDRIGAFYDDGTTHDRLYVSRSRWPKQRRLVNEAEIEADMQALGFHIVHPETLSVPDQVRIFRNATVIAGPSGSGLYNCVYTRPQGERIILASSSFVTFNDTLVNARTRAPITYLTGAPLDPAGPGMLADWSIDPALVRDFVAARLA